MVKWLIFIYDDDNWEGLHSTMFRVGYDIDDCENQETIVLPSRILQTGHYENDLIMIL